MGLAGSDGAQIGNGKAYSVYKNITERRPTREAYSGCTQLNRAMWHVK
ncbi:MAG: hypothetical protein FIO03_06850 [Nitrosopumilales archaeon]|nr:hypothetical protein [Nitrosopumilales archaeon]